jgi:MoxR-like ATPase
MPADLDALSPAALERALRTVGYLADQQIAGTLFLAERIGKPVLVEGPAGTGKTSLARSVAELTGSRLIRLQCYEGLDETKALYEWNYRKQLLRIQAGNDAGWDEVEQDIFGEGFLLARPLLEAIRSDEPVVLLIDEVDRLDPETEALLLEVLSEYQVSVPELGTITATTVPRVFLTSNNTRELSEALKRRCLFLFLDYPTADREREIVRAQVPAVSALLAQQIADVIESVRRMDLKKRPSVSETLDWARSLVALGVDDVDEAAVLAGLNVILKHRTDIDVVADEIRSRPA